jgi:hypothetical protein
MEVANEPNVGEANDEGEARNVKVEGGCDIASQDGVEQLALKECWGYCAV